jgi:succinylglutamate desuccinylase
LVARQVVSDLHTITRTSGRSLIAEMQQYSVGWQRSQISTSRQL